MSVNWASFLFFFFFNMTYVWEGSVPMIFEINETNDIYKSIPIKREFSKFKTGKLRLCLVIYVFNWDTVKIAKGNFNGPKKKLVCNYLVLKSWPHYGLLAQLYTSPGSSPTKPWHHHYLIFIFAAHEPIFCLSSSWRCGQSS